MNKRKISIIITCAILLVAGISYCTAMNGCSKAPVLSADLQEKVDLGDNLNPQMPSKGPVPVSVTVVPETKEIYVHICGAVVHTGVYNTVSGARICDIIKLAGGLTSNAAGDFVNQAVIVTDGQRIYIPTQEEVKDMPDDALMEGDLGKSEDGEKSSTLLNINTADAEGLMTLPGIGQAKADSIIDYRTRNGDFHSVDELMSIPGIKEGIYNRIASLITVK